MAFVDQTTGGRIVRAVGPVSKLTVKAATTVNPGDALGYSSGWVPADADAVIHPEFVAIGRSLGGDEIQVTRIAEIDFGTGCTATAHDLIYMGSTAGVYSATAVSSFGLQVGEMVSAQIGVVSLGGGAPQATVQAVGTTAATNSTPFGWATAAQADAVRSQLNLVIAALKTAGILSN